MELSFSWHRWLNRLTGLVRESRRRQRIQRRGPARRRLSLESLEDRTLLSGSPVGAGLLDLPPPQAPSLGYSTLLRGNGYDNGNGIAVDPSGNLYVAGNTGSPGFPGPNGTTETNAGSFDAFVVKLADQDASTPAATIALTGTSVTQNDDGSYRLTYGTNYDVSVIPTGTNGMVPTLTYYVGTDTSGAGSGTAPTDAGTYTVVASVQYDTDYPIASAVFTIDKANAVIHVQDYNGPYDDQPHGVSGSAIGVWGEDLSDLLDLGFSGYTSVGSQTVYWSFAGNDNYNYDSGTAVVRIGQRITFSDSSYTFTYNGWPQFLGPLDVTVDGGNFSIGSNSLSFFQGSYGSLDELDAAIADGTAVQVNNTPVNGPIDAGNYTVLASYAGLRAIAPLTIDKANASIYTSEDSSVPYDGNAHGLSGSAFGVRAEDLSSLLDLGPRYTAPGTYNVPWTFAGNSNYNAASGTVTITIVANPTPVLAGLSQTTIAASSASFTLTVNGSNFVPTSVVQWNGTALATTYVNSGQLAAVVPAANLTAAGTVSVTVVNPAGGGVSNAQTFTVTEASSPSEPITEPPPAQSAALPQEWSAVQNYYHFLCIQHFLKAGLDPISSFTWGKIFGQFNVNLGALRGASPLTSLFLFNHFLNHGGDPFSSAVLATSLTGQGNTFTPASGSPSERVQTYYQNLGLPLDDLSDPYAQILGLGWPDDAIAVFIAAQHGTLLI